MDLSQRYAAASSPAGLKYGGGPLRIFSGANFWFQVNVDEKPDAGDTEHLACSPFAYGLATAARSRSLLKVQGKSRASVLVDCPFQMGTRQAGPLRRLIHESFHSHSLALLNLLEVATLPVRPAGDQHTRVGDDRISGFLHGVGRHVCVHVSRSGIRGVREFPRSVCRSDSRTEADSGHFRMERVVLFTRWVAAQLNPRNSASLQRTLR